MRKERNVIRFFIVLAFLLNVSRLPAQQKINGKYSMVDGTGYFWTDYTFDINSTFTFEEGGDLGTESYGQDHYTIKNDSLFLNYDLTELKEESYFKAKKYYNFKDSIQIKLNIYNYNHEPLYNMQVYAFPKRKSTESDKNGLAVLKFKKEKRKDKLEIHIDGEFLAKQIIYLDFDINYNIDVFMNESVIQGFGHPEAIKNQIDRFKIIEISEKHIRLENNNKEIKLIKMLQ